MVKVFKALLTFIFICCDAFCLECRFYNVGQGNLVVVKNGVHSLVIDCGNKLSFTKLKGTEKNNKENEFLKAIGDFIEESRVSLVITHQHFDHYNYVQKLHSKLRNGFDRNRILIGGRSASDKPTEEQISGIIDESNFCEVVENATITDKAGKPIIRDTLPLILTRKFIFDWLGKEVEIELLLPKTSAGVGEHEQNLVLKITYAGRSLLFPGDASGKLLDRIITTDESVLNNIDCMLLSHHGSNDSGELAWFTLATQKAHQENSSLLTIVSSDPNGAHNLPWNIVKKLKCVFSDKDYCTGHNIDIRGQSKGVSEKFYTDNVENHIQPLFVTCNSTTNYYKISISPGGTITLQDGEGIPQFCSFHTGVDKKLKIQNILDEMYKCFINDLIETPFNNWLLGKINTYRGDLTDELLREHGKQRHSWDVFSSKLQSLNSSNPIELTNSLMLKLYNAWLEPPSQEGYHISEQIDLIQELKHYNRNTGYTENEIYYPDNGWTPSFVRDAIEVIFESFEQFLSSVRILEPKHTDHLYAPETLPLH